MEGSTPRIMSKKQSGMTASQSSIANAISQIGLEPPGAVTPNITQREREERGRLLREKNTEERSKKLEELKQQALAAQKYREQKEVERRQRIDDMRLKDSERRTLVEERKRLLWEAEQEKRDSILRKAQEREARYQAKRRNERSSIVFAFGSSTPRMLEPVSSTSFWGRRAASTINVGYSGAPLTRRMSERELNLDSSYKKQRATSAHALHRKVDDSGSSSVPLSRPQSAISNLSDDKHPTVIHRPRSSVRPRPNSIAVSGINLSIAVSKELKNIDCKSPEPKTPKSTSRSNSATRPPSKSTVKKTNPPAKRDVASVPTTPSEPKKSLPAAKAPKPVSKSASKDSIGSNQASSKASPEPEEVQPIKNESESEQQQQETEPVPATESAEADAGKEELPECDMTSSFTTRRIASEEEAKAALTERRRQMREQQEKEAALAEELRKLELEKEEEERRERQKKVEEAKARHEEFERQNELRRQEEQKRRDEEEQRLKEEAEREAEARRQEEEERLAMEKEQERKALEEAEKQRQEIAERLRKEEEERQARRKRVEMIMTRTRKNGNNSSVSNKDDSTEETEGRVSPSDTVESANNINNIKEALDKSVCQPTSDIIMGDVMLVNSTSQETNGHNKNE